MHFYEMFEYLILFSTEKKYLKHIRNLVIYVKQTRRPTAGFRQEACRYCACAGYDPSKFQYHTIRFPASHCTVERYSLIKPKKYLLQKLNFGLKASLRQNSRF